jgi:hypothetical protein
MTVYQEKFEGSDMATGTLAVVKRKNGLYSLIAYLPADYPDVLVNGTLDDCRDAWLSAKTWIKRYLGVK